VKIKAKTVGCKRIVNGHVELIKFLHVHGADMMTADQYGATPLHYAIQMCAQHHHHHQQQQQQQQDEDSNEMSRDDEVVDRLDVLRAVLTRTDMIDLVDQQHRTPLIWTASCGNFVPVYYAPPHKGVFPFRSSVPCSPLTHKRKSQNI